MNEKKSNRRVLVVVSAVLFALMMSTLASASRPDGGEVLSIAAAPAVQAGPLAPVGSGFTYQGRLKDGANPANGQYDLQFKLYDTLSGGNQVASTFTQPNQTVTDGLFTVQLDFGANTFVGDARWLEIAVRAAGVGSYITLSPRQSLTAVPYAMSLATGNSGAAVSGAVPGPALVVTNTNGFGISGVSNGANGIGMYGVANNGASATGVYGQSSTGTGTVGYSTASGTGVHAIYGLASGTDATAVHGVANTGVSAKGVWGQSAAGQGVRGESNSGIGVYGSSAGDYAVYGYGAGAIGVYGISNDLPGVFGQSTNHSGVGGASTNSVGVAGYASATNKAGVYGSNGSGYGVEGNGATGVRGTSSSGPGNGVYGENTSTTGYGVFGVNNNPNASARGVVGQSNVGVGTYGLTATGTGIIGASTSSGTGVYGTSSTGWAGWFQGNVNVTGTCCLSGAGAFRIDHPLDPQSKYLVQAAVQAPDLKSVYDGNVTTNASGEAVVTLPDYVEALNTDFRYQLTIVGDRFAQARVSSKIKDNRFAIKTNQPNVEVSWQVTGIRKDPYAQAHPIEAEVDKPADEQGKYQHPTEWGEPESKGIGYEERQQMEREHPAPSEPVARDRP